MEGGEKNEPIDTENPTHRRAHPSKWLVAHPIAPQRQKAFLLVSCEAAVFLKKLLSVVASRENRKICKRKKYKNKK
jgi:hypothetical protein